MHTTRLNRFLLVIALLLFGMGTSFAQKSLEDANKEWERQAYFEAAELYKKGIAKEKDREVKAFGTFRIAECYRLATQPKLAEGWYERAIKAGYTEPEVYLNYAGVLRNLEKYNEAVEQYNKYLATNPTDEAAKRQMEGSKLATTWKEAQTRYTVTNAATFNTNASDYGVTLFKKNGLFFSSARESAVGKSTYDKTGEKFSSIFETYIDKRGKWSTPVLIAGPVNTSMNEGALTFNKAFTIMLFTRCDTKKGLCKIYESRKQGNGWGEPKLVSIFGDSITVGQPALSPDGRTLYFVADNAPDGYGGKDIWMVPLNKSEEQPVNLGPSINTPGNEMFPYLHPSGTLYFSSDYHLGMGGLDIFSSEGGGNEWSKPENLKAPFNSGADDFAYISNAGKTRGFLSSNRLEGRGMDDIYEWVLTPLEFSVKGVIRNETDQKPIPGAQVKLFLSDSTFVDTIADASGNYSFTLKEGYNYALQANKKDFFGNNGKVSTEGEKYSKVFTVDIALKPIPREEIQLEDILYDLGSDKLTAASKKSLESLVTMLKSSPELKIGINSHTDSRDTEANNLDLSQRRAQSVVNFLIENGIEEDRLKATGFGESQLLNRCADGVKCTEEEHAVNRRTTFQVLSTDYKGIIKYKRVTGQTDEDDFLKGE